MALRNRKSCTPETTTTTLDLQLTNDYIGQHLAIMVLCCNQQPDRPIYALSYHPNVTVFENRMLEHQRSCGSSSTNAYLMVVLYHIYRFVCRKHKRLSAL